jgi:mRNA interferase HicA
MKLSEFARWLKAQGVIFKEGKKHTKLYYGKNQSTLPRHSAEIKEPLRKGIIKQLGLIDKE